KQDGTRITYARQVQGPGRLLHDIQVALPDGSGAVTVSTPDPATQDDTGPHWWLDDQVLFTRDTTGSGKQIWAAKTDGSGQRLVLDNAALNAVNPKTGDIVVTGGGAATLRTYDPATGGFGPPQALPYEIVSGLHEGLVFSPDGGKMAVTDYGRLYVAAADGSALREVYAGQCVNVTEFAWSPTGDRLALQINQDAHALTIVDLLGNVVRQDGVWLGEQGLTGPFFWQPNVAAPAPTPPPAAPAIPPAPAAFAPETPIVMPLDNYHAEGKCQAVIARSAADGSVWMRVDRGFNETATPWTRIGGPALDITYAPIGGSGALLVARNPADRSLWALRDGALPGQWRQWARIGDAAEDVHLMGRPQKSSNDVLVLARDPGTHAIRAFELSSSWPTQPTGPVYEFGGPAAEVDVAQNPAGGLAVVARSTGDGSVWGRQWTSSYPQPSLGPWIKLGGPARSTAMANAAEGPVVVAQNPADGSLWATTTFVENARWQQVGGPALDAAAAAGHDGDFSVIARNTADKSLWISPNNHSTNGQWAPQPWARLGDPASALPGVLALPTGGTRVASVGANGALKVGFCGDQWNCA
ncbi:MAG: hypothetical protein HOV68_16965, partial [Streptomycetaceae bacterium]|nr:hypothetical protein [Streptomycetaceae bacterium]